MSTVTIEDLKTIPFLKDIADPDLEIIKDIVSEKQFLTSDIIVGENAIADSFCIIKKGQVQISKRFEDGNEMIIDMQKDGDFFGELALLDEGLRSATVRAVIPTTIFEISRKDFNNLLEGEPRLALKIMKVLSLRLRETGNMLITHLQRRNVQLTKAYRDTITAVANSIDARDPYTRGHTQRVTIIAEAIAREMGIAEEDLFILEIGTLLHDVGKIGLSDAVLFKPGELDSDEYEHVKEHPITGEKIIRNISYLEDAMPIIRFHHERYDGAGYPDKTIGKDIPLAGRIVAVADAFDAMTSDRPYRKRMAYDRAIEELKKESGKQFDPEIVTTFSMIWQRENLQEEIEALHPEK